MIILINNSKIMKQPNNNNSAMDQTHLEAGIIADGRKVSWRKEMDTNATSRAKCHKPGFRQKTHRAIYFLLC